MAMSMETAGFTPSHYSPPDEGDPLKSIFGGVPAIADFVKTILGKEQQTAVRDNLAAFPDIANLGNIYQTYMLQQLNNAIPGFSEILKMGGQTTADMLGQADLELHGYVPPDVAAQIQRSSAFTSLMGGTEGSSMARGLTARDLGMTSLNLIQQGAQLAGQGGNAAQRWAQIAAGTSFNPGSMFVNPMEQYGATLQNNILQQQTMQAKLNAAAAPNPGAKGLFDTAVNLVGAYLGKGMNKSPTAPPDEFKTFNPNQGSPGSPGGQTSGYNFGGEPFNLGVTNPFGQPGTGGINLNLGTTPQSYTAPYYNPSVPGGADLWNYNAGGMPW